MEEIWKQIEDDGVILPYEVSNFNRVRNMRTGKILKHNEAGNYHGLTLNDASQNYRKRKSVHRLVAKAFVHNPDPEKFTDVDHVDCNKNNNADNLEWVTPRENHRRTAENGLYRPRRGEESNLCKYSDDEIRNVIKLLERGKLTYREISEKTGVSLPYIKDINCGINRTDIPRNLSRRKSKQGNFKQLHEYVNWRIIKNKSRKATMSKLINEFGLTKLQAKHLWGDRKRAMQKLHKDYVWIYTDNDNDDI